MSSSESDDENYVPEETSQDADASDVAIAGEHDKSLQTQSVTTNASVNAAWKDINASTNVSETAADKTAKLLKRLTSRKAAQPSKKRKLREFQMPVLSVDVKKSRLDLALAGEKPNQVGQVVKFAGVEYSVSTSIATSAKKPISSNRSNSNNGGGTKKLDQVLASLDAPKKVSTMEKTSIDWDKFKQDEGIESELTQYTKDGYIEKQEFLQRLDLKRFEIEKAEREKQRKQLQQQQQT